MEKVQVKKDQQLQFIIDNKELFSNYDFKDVYLRGLQYKMSKEFKICVPTQNLNYWFSYEDNVELFFNEQVKPRFKTWDNYRKFWILDWVWSKFTILNKFEIKIGNLIYNKEISAIIDYVLDGCKEWKIDYDRYNHNEDHRIGDLDHRGIHWKVFLNGKVKFKGMTEEQWALVVDHHNMVNKRDYFETEK